MQERKEGIVVFTPAIHSSYLSLVAQWEAIILSYHRKGPPPRLSQYTLVLNLVPFQEYTE